MKMKKKYESDPNFTYIEWEVGNPRNIRLKTKWKIYYVFTGLLTLCSAIVIYINIIKIFNL